jgi:hypothetical protein
MTDHQIRQQLAAQGIIDQHAEQFIINLNREFNEKMELERVKVDRRVWDLEDELLEERMK